MRLGLSDPGKINRWNFEHAWGKPSQNNTNIGINTYILQTFNQTSTTI
jgi:hypothetical protein